MGAPRNPPPPAPAPDEPTRALSASLGEHTEPNAFDIPVPAVARGESVGRYVVLEQIGAGGMGVVYAAYDPELDRRVALKLLRPLGERGERLARARARLIREAKAMAKVSHPNVLPVYDVGEVGDRVFVALEFVDGQTLGAWLADGPHPLGEVLARFIAAGRGLAAAHAEELVHRDFKPHNVLLGKRGEVRVMDFGLARPAPDTQSVSDDRDRDREDATSMADGTLTVTGVVLGTPAYMAPEQRRSTVVDHRADQFSFCVALYEALYGTRPFAGTRVAEINDAILEQRFATPAFDIGAPGWLRKAVLRGLAARADDRWPDMDALLAALERDRTRRRRVALFGVGALAVATGIGVASFEAASGEDKCRGVGEVIAGSWNDEVAASLGSAFASSGLSYADDAWARTANALGGYASEWSSQRVDACEATHVRGEQSGDLLDRRMACLDRRRQELDGLLAVFAEPDRTTIDRALEAVSGLPRPATCSNLVALAAAVEPPPDEETKAEVDRLRGELGRVRALGAAARYDDELEAADAVLAAAELTGYRPLVAEATLQRAEALSGAGKFADAEAAGLAAALAAEELGMDTVAGRAHGFLARVVGNKLARHDEGRRHGELALAKFERTGGDWRQEAEVYTNLSEIADQEGDYANARRWCEQALDLWQENDRDGPRYAVLLGNYGRVAYRERDFVTAVKYFEQARDILVALHGPRHPEVAKAISNIATARHELGEFAAARDELQKAADIIEAALGPTHPDLAITLTNLGSANLRLGDYERALEVTRRAIDIKIASLGREHPSVGYTLNNAALLLMRLDRDEEALATYREALANLEGGLGPEHPGVIEPLLGIGEVLQELDRTEESLPLLERALAVSIAVGDPPERLAPVQFVLARALWSTGDRTRATELVDAAREGFRLGNDEQALGDVQRWIERSDDGGRENRRDE